MTVKLNRITILLIGISIVIIFLFLNRFDYIIGSTTTIGEVKYIKMWTQGTISRTHYTAPIISFNYGSKTITFQAETNMDLEKGEKVNVIYKNKNPQNARIYSFIGFWLAPILYSMIPLLFLTALILSFINKSDEILFSFNKGFTMKRINRKLNEDVGQLKE